jgi:hypothetical protein
MRAFQRTVLATSLTLAFAAATAHAQTLRVGPSTPPSSTTATTTLNGTPGPTGTAGNSSNTTTSGTSSTGTTGSTTGTTTTTTTGTTGTTGTTATGTTAGTTAGTSISGTSTGDAFSGSSRGNAPPMGAASVQNNAVVNSGSNFNANGERIGVLTPDAGVIVGGGVASGSAGASGGGGASDTGGGNAGFNAGFANANTATGTAGVAGVSTTPELDRATRREAERARRTVETRSQMMHSIAPRTNVDRTDQMPDDRTPLLSPGRP